MKKYWFSFLGMLAAFLVLSVSVVRYSRQQYQQEYSTYEGMVSSDSAVLDEYYLPYPGMLPDHSLYFVKMARDRLRLMVTKDDIARVELYLYYADKRIGAAEVLLKGNKIALAEVTAVKAEQYMSSAMEILRGFDESERQDHVDLWWKYFRSITAHKELLEEMTMMLEGEARMSMEKVLRDCEARRAEIMGELKIEESEAEIEVMDEDLYDPDQGYL